MKSKPPANDARYEPDECADRRRNPTTSRDTAENSPTRRWRWIGHGIAALLLLASIAGPAPLEFLQLPVLMYLCYVVVCSPRDGRLRRSVAVGLSLGLCTLAVVARLQGFRLYGSPTLRDNRPLLDHPLVVERFDPPNVVIATDGSRHLLRGLELAPELAEYSGGEQLAALGYLARPSNQDPIRFLPCGDRPSGFVVERRIHYWCGHTWMPHPFPGRLESHRTDDLGQSLRNCGALRTDERTSRIAMYLDYVRPTR